MASHAKHGSKRSDYSKMKMPMHDEKMESEMKPMMKGMAGKPSRKK